MQGKRFSKQRTLSECAPRAIYNAQIWANVKPLSMSKLKAKCKTTKHGTDDAPLIGTINSLFKVKKIAFTKLHTLQNDEAAFMWYYVCKRSRLEGHCVLVIRSGAYFFVINHISHKHLFMTNKSNMAKSGSRNSEVT